MYVDLYAMFKFYSDMDGDVEEEFSRLSISSILSPKNEEGKIYILNKYLEISFSYWGDKINNFIN